MSDPTVVLNGFCLVNQCDPVTAVVRISSDFLLLWNEMMSDDNDVISRRIDSFVDITEGQNVREFHVYMGRSPIALSRLEVQVYWKNSNGHLRGVRFDNAEISPMSMVTSNNPAALDALLSCRHECQGANIIIRSAVRHRQAESISILAKHGYRMDGTGAIFKKMTAEEQQYLFSVYREMDLQVDAKATDKLAPVRVRL